MIVISYGMPKSASSFVYLLTNEIVNTISPRYLLKQRLPKHLQKHYIGDVSNNLDTLIEHIPSDQFYAIKTHQHIDDHIKYLLNENRVIGTITYRDPYDVLVSMLDVGKKERLKIKEEQRKEFAVFETIEDALAQIPNYIYGCSSWLAEADNFPNILKFSYEIIKNSPVDLVEKIASTLEIKVDSQAIVDKYLHDKSLIWEYNQGESGRGYREITVPKDHPSVKIMDDFKLRYLS